MDQLQSNDGLEYLHVLSEQGDLDLLLEEVVPVCGHAEDGFLVLEATRDHILKEVDPKFINHLHHYNLMFRGGDGIPPGGGLDSKAKVVLGDREIHITTNGSWEWVKKKGRKKRKYTQKFSIPYMSHIAKGEKKSWREKALAMLNGHLKVHCNCPAFKYFYQHTADRKGFSIYPQKTPSNIRNPGKRGGLCKHLHLALRFLPTYWSTLASQLKKRHESST